MNAPADPRPRGLSLFHPTGGLGVKPNPFGKDVANAGLFRALIQHGGFDRVHFATARPIAPTELASEAGHAPMTTLSAGPLTDPAPLRHTGMLLRGQPDLAELAWMRRRSGGDGSWSLAGLIHTLAPPATRAIIADSLIAPVQPWDALICTSPAVVEAVEVLFDGWSEHLRERLGGAGGPRPQLPIIPLGVEASAFAQARRDEGARAGLRAELGVEDGDVLVAWVGRLSFFEKAFPQPMFRAVAEAASACPQAAVHFVMAGWFPGGGADQARYEEAAAAYASGVKISFLDGNDPRRVAALWAAADIFLSLVDNIQETFGITPVEAMAAGLPVVVSDWDGYRSTVRHGIDGFLVPTLGGATGSIGEPMAAAHNLGADSYQAYVGGVAHHTAVDVHEAASALSSLIRDPDLRKSLGAAGSAHVREELDWPVIARRYRALFGDLAQERARASKTPARPRLNPIRGDPFADFTGFATQTLRPQTRLFLRATDVEAELERMATVQLDKIYGGWRVTPDETRRLLRSLKDQSPIASEDLLADWPPARRPAGQATLMWLAKLGVIGWS